MSGRTEQGALGDSYTISSKEARLSGTFEIDVLVESVNDRPEIGSLQPVPTQVTNVETGLIVVVELDSLAPVDEGNSTKCMAMNPASRAYQDACAAGRRAHIDVDEDTIFTMTPDLLWINDVDSAEAIIITDLGRQHYHCADELSLEGCYCGQACTCGGALCRCAEPAPCDTDLFTPGELLVELRVSKGRLSIQPPPGRNMVPVKFLQNVSNAHASVHECLLALSGEGDLGSLLPLCYETCPNQLACSTNASFLLFQTTTQNLQVILRQKYLTYVGDENLYGIDELRVWVADQGFTDDWYNLRKSYIEAAERTIPIRIVGVNDPPVVTIPDYVLRYQINTMCHFDWAPTENKRGAMCPLDSPNLDLNSRVPPMRPGTTGGMQALTYQQEKGREPFIHISDVDLMDNVYGNLTLTIEIGTGTGRKFGEFTIAEILPKVELFQFYRPATRVQTLQIKGGMSDINVLMTRLYYSSETDRMGYAPFIVKVSDNNNYGECSGAHFCGTDEPCDDGRKGEPHRASQAAEGKQQIDVIVGTVIRCQHEDCESCNAEAGCGWCPSTCEGLADVETGKCMIGNEAPLYDTCPPSADGRLFGQCTLATTPIVLIVVPAVVSLLVVGYVVWRVEKFLKRRHGGMILYSIKKLRTTRHTLRRWGVFPPEDANYLQFFTMVVIVLAIFGVNVALEPGMRLECVYNTQVFIDQSFKITMELDKCLVRFLPARPSNWADESDWGVPAIKIKVAYEINPEIVMVADTCYADASIRITNSLPVDIKYKTYYCNIAVLVPDKSIVPTMVIRDFNGMATQVRAGAMDKDSQDFKVDFGPNSFEIEGSVVNARLRGVEARSFRFDADAGSLFIEDLVTGLQGAVFSSRSADLMVTTTRPTSVRFWQRDGNKVCLSAARNSLYVDGNCKEVCAFLPAKADDDSAEPFVVPDNREDCLDERVAGEWDELTDPASCRLRCSSLKRPLVPGCYNLDACILIETPQCLCKPSCDLVPPALLAYDGFSSIQVGFLSF